jgi:hypothetical protein
MADNDMKTLDYGAVLADLEAKRTAIEQAITSLRVAAASGALIGKFGDSMPPMSDNVSITLGPRGGEVPVGAFLGKSILEAAKLCLQIVKRKMTTREITDALQKGGIETTAKTSFPAIVHSILMRANRAGTGIVKVDRSHWGLGEWYPASLRGSGPPNRGNGRKEGRRANKHPKRDSSAESRTETVPHKIWQVLNKPGVELSAQEVAARVGTKANVAAMLLARLAKLGNAEKTPTGKYRAIAA